MLNPSREDARPVKNIDDLLEVFHAAEKPEARFLLGTEAEKFGVHRESYAPLAYEGEHGVARILNALTALGWQPEAETEGGPVIALRREEASITLEPGAQLELSGAALPDVHGTALEISGHLRELAQISSEMKLVWLSVGFHPLARQLELPWVPKQRYAIMREYLPPLGHAALDMMRRTATVQVNLDFSSEEDAIRKLTVGLKLAPLIHAMLANSPFRELRAGGPKSLRGQVWLNMDRSRSGLVERVLNAPRPSYKDYIEWALDAGMFLLKRGERVLANTGQTFRDFLLNGYSGEHATVADFKLHLNTLFPEMRLKNTLELRSVDALPARLMTVVPALGAGLFYESRALAEAEALARSIGVSELAFARKDLVEQGLGARVGTRWARDLASKILEIAHGGLSRRKRLDAQGQDETIYLREVTELASRGLCPADLLRMGLEGSGPYPAATLIERTRIDAAAPQVL
ncbi:MAG TPA: glutamate-cysteine ligase family protein [Polyangiaceae bacterium]|nr:glutamate-cysteine ligase family protein [Polyangiaceae bacterium]